MIFPTATGQPIRSRPDVLHVRMRENRVTLETGECKGIHGQRRPPNDPMLHSIDGFIDEADVERIDWQQTRARGVNSPTPSNWAEITFNVAELSVG